MAYTIDELFPTKGSSNQSLAEIRELLSYGYDKARLSNHKFFTIEHILYGYMQFITINTNSGDTVNYRIFPWFCDSRDYFRKSNLKNLPVQFKESKSIRIDGPVYLVSKEYKKYMNVLNMETFFYLILYMNVTTFSNEYYIPIRQPSLETFFRSNSFDIFLKTPNSTYYSSKILEQNFTSNSEKNAWLALFLSIRNISSYPDYESNDSDNHPLIDIPIEESKYSKPYKLEMTTDITHLAYKNNFPLLVGRTVEMNRLTDILSKKIKHNAVLIGESGVGKTALIHALAEKIAANNVPEHLKNYRIIELDVASTIAGTMYRGEFEKRIKKIIDAIESSNEKLILYIDDLHTIMGLGSSRDGSLTLSELLKPIMLKPTIRIIGTSTFKDYRQIEADKAFERRFDTITINEPTFKETIQILNIFKKEFEKFYHVTIPTETLKATINLSKKYIPEQYLPSKAIDLLDESCAMVSNNIESLIIRTDLKSLADILPDDISKCISRKKNIPVADVRTSLNLEDLENNLSSKIIGQNHAAKIIAQSVYRAKAGFNDETRPLASFLFIGPTGVGKTEMAKALSDFMFSGRENMIKIDMSEYVEEHSISKLIGSPPGYIGYEDAGILSEQVRRHPYSLVLFDEIEKAHKKIYNILLQILDEGCLTDSHGEKINFKNTIIVLTSNTGVSEISKKSVGFVDNPNDKSKDILNAVKKEFPPEFLNRLDDIIQFNSLTEDNIFEIAKNCINKDIIQKQKNKGIEISIPDDVIHEIAKHGYKVEYGARELKRTINRELSTKLAKFILQNNEIESITVDYENSEFVVSETEALLV